MMLKKDVALGRVPLGAAILLAASILPACAASPTAARADKAGPTKARSQATSTDKAQQAQIARLQLELASSQAQVSALKKQLAQMMAQPPQTQAAAQPKEKKPVPAVLNFTLKNLEGKDVNLSQYAGQAVMIVNTASKCGNTPQYEGLQKLYDKYKAQGFVILGFPSNDFNGQEPGSDADIAAFCHQNYGVSFPMFSKVQVKGEGKTPLYEFLTSEKTNPDSPGEIDWNFAKFIIGRDGKIAARFKASVKPETPEVTAAIEKALQPVA